MQTRRTKRINSKTRRNNMYRRRTKKGGFFNRINYKKTYLQNFKDWKKIWSKNKNYLHWDPSYYYPGITNLFMKPIPGKGPAPTTIDEIVHYHYENHFNTAFGVQQWNGDWHQNINNNLINNKLINKCIKKKTQAQNISDWEKYWWKKYPKTDKNVYFYWPANTYMEPIKNKNSLYIKDWVTTVTDPGEVTDSNRPTKSTSPEDTFFC